VASFHAQSFLVLPPARSIPALKTAEKLTQIIKFSQVSVLLHQADLPNWKEGSVQPLSYGNSDALFSAIRNNPSRDYLNKQILEQAKGGNLLKSLSKNRYDAIICNFDDPLCDYLSKNLKIENKILLTNSCPRQWNDVFGEITTGNSFVEKIVGFLKSLFSPKKQDFEVKYNKNSLYLSQCFQPVLNPQPKLENIYPIGSYIGAPAKGIIPDHYQKPVRMASKIVIVYLGEDERAYHDNVLEIIKLFPHYLFVIVSKTFDLNQYAKGNVIVDEHAPLDELMSHQNTAFLISNGEWTILMNAFYHNLPAITIGSSSEGVAGRQFVRDKKVGIDLTQSGGKVNNQQLENAIREAVFDPTYRNNLKDIARYLKGMNTNYLLPNIIIDFFSAKNTGQTTDL